MTRLAEYGSFCFKHRGAMFPIALVLLLLPSPHLGESPVAVGLAGLALGALGQVIRIGTVGLAYIIRGGKDHRVYAEELVKTGVYAHTRNPMYLGNLFLLLGVALASNSWVFALLGTALGVLLHALIIAAEEDFLERKFGEEFQAYRRSVPRLLPKLGGILNTLRSMPFDWQRVLAKEYAAPIDWLSATAIVALINIWRAGQADTHPGSVALMVLVVLGRLVAWPRARAKRRSETAASAGTG